MSELELAPISTVSAAITDHADGDSRRIGLVLLIGICVIVYASAMFGIARAWDWVSTHFSSVELLGVAAAIVLAIQIYVRMREANRLTASRQITVRGVWGVWVLL